MCGAVVFTNTMNMYNVEIYILSHIYIYTHMYIHMYEHRHKILYASKFILHLKWHSHRSLHAEERPWGATAPAARWHDPTRSWHPNPPRWCGWQSVDRPAPPLSKYQKSRSWNWILEDLGVFATKNGRLKLKGSIYRWSLSLRNEGFNTNLEWDRKKLAILSWVGMFGV